MILKIVEDSCWKCEKPVKLPFVDNTIGPESYKEELIKIANKQGANIQHKLSKTIQESYNASVCPHCNSIFGQFLLYKYFYSPVLKEIEVGSEMIITDENDIPISNV